MNILVTGGTGFIGSHASMALLNAGHDVSIIDNLSNSDVHVIKRLEMLSSSSIDFEEVDITNKESLELFFNNRNIEGVMHFAGMKAVSESTKEPLMYFQNNIIGTINLLASMKKFNVKKLIFSSSATVYGDPSYLPIDENHPTCAINPYGRTKLHLEEMIRDLAMSDPDLNHARSALQKLDHLIVQDIFLTEFQQRSNQFYPIKENEVWFYSTHR